jgi:hypothetical protein
VIRFVGAADGLQLAENFDNLRGPGQAIQLYSGAHKRRIRTSYCYHNGQFRCGQINILMALTDVGPGAEATMGIPRSHKSNIIHPQFENISGLSGSMNATVGAVEVHMKVGDAILFVDSMSLGSAVRTNLGERRIIIYRYGPQSENYFRGFLTSTALLGRLTDRRRQIVHPIPSIRAPGV